MYTNNEFAGVVIVVASVVPVNGILGIKIPLLGLGDLISISDQNLTKQTCYPGNGYEVGDDWKLADWNGDLNGGHYNVIFIDMSATW